MTSYREIWRHKGRMWIIIWRQWIRPLQSCSPFVCKHRHVWCQNICFRGRSVQWSCFQDHSDSHYGYRYHSYMGCWYLSNHTTCISRNSACVWRKLSQDQCPTLWNMIISSLSEKRNVRKTSHMPINEAKEVSIYILVMSHSVVTTITVLCLINCTCNIIYTHPYNHRIICLIQNSGYTFP